MDNFAKLSKEAQLLVFSKLSTRDKQKCNYVCKTWHRLITDNVLYHEVLIYKNDAHLKNCLKFFSKHRHLGQQTRLLSIRECNIDFDTLLRLPDLFPNIQKLKFITVGSGRLIGEKASSPNIKKFREQMQKWTQIEWILEINSQHPIITSALLLQPTKLKTIYLQQTTRIAGVRRGRQIYHSTAFRTAHLLERKRLFMDNLVNAPRLKSLTLQRASLRPADLADLNKHCPNLQSLTLKQCYLNICSNFPLTLPESPSAANKFIADDKTFVNRKLKSLLIDVHPEKSRPEFGDKPNFAWLMYISHHYQCLTSFEFVCRAEERAQLKVPQSRIKAYNDMATHLLDCFPRYGHFVRFQVMHWPPNKQVQHHIDLQRETHGYRTIYTTKKNIQRRMTNLAESKAGRHVHYLHVNSADGVLDYDYKKPSVAQQQGNDSSDPINVDQNDDSDDVVSSSDEDDFEDEYDSATTEEDPDWLDYKYERKMRHRERIRFIRRHCAGYGSDDDDPVTMGWNSDTDSSMSDHDPFTGYPIIASREAAPSHTSLKQSLDEMNRLESIHVECLNGSSTDFENIPKVLHTNPVRIHTCAFTGLTVKYQARNTTTSDDQGQQQEAGAERLIIPPYTPTGFGFAFSSVQLLCLYRCVVENLEQIQHINVILNDVLHHSVRLRKFCMNITRKQQQQQQPPALDDRSKRLSLNFQRNSVLRSIEFNTTQQHPIQPYAMCTSDQKWHYFHYLQNSKTFVSISQEEFTRAPQLHVEILLPKQPVSINAKKLMNKLNSSKLILLLDSRCWIVIKKNGAIYLVLLLPHAHKSQ